MSAEPPDSVGPFKDPVLPNLRRTASKKRNTIEPAPPNADNVSRMSTLRSRTTRPNSKALVAHSVHSHSRKSLAAEPAAKQRARTCKEVQTAMRQGSRRAAQTEAADRTSSNRRIRKKAVAKRRAAKITVPDGQSPYQEPQQDFYTTTIAEVETLGQNVHPRTRDIVEAYLRNIRLSELPVPADELPSGLEMSVNRILTRKAQRTALLRQHYRSLGYTDSHLDRMSIAATTVNTSQEGTRTEESSIPADRIVAVAGSKNFGLGLRSRSVSQKASMNAPARDPFTSIVERASCVGTIDILSTREVNWQNDLEKCSRSHKRLFQHTIMMEILDRHSLDSIFYYGCQGMWRSVRPPARPGSTIVLKRPKVDLFVGFQGKFLLGNFDSLDLGGLIGYLCPDNRTFRTHRAFPFLVFEVKGKTDDLAALDRVLNDAHYLLYNIWKFVEGGDYEEEFFNTARVFTVSASPSRCYIYMHWTNREAAVRRADVPIRYFYQKVASLSGKTEYSHARTCWEIQNTLEYGKNVLFEFLKKVVPDAINRMQAPPLSGA